MDTIFKYEEGCVWYMYDIVICGGETEAVYQANVAKILQQCVHHDLAVNPTKSEFHVHETLFQGHILNVLRLR